jgi:hypothetical protein
MNQMGMQMPGGKSRRGAGVDVYTALMFVATMCLLAACGFVFVQGAKVGPAGSAFKLQGDRIELQPN